MGKNVTIHGKRVERVQNSNRLIPRVICYVDFDSRYTAFHILRTGGSTAESGELRLRRHAKDKL